MSAASNPFRPPLFAFLSQLARNNRRDWFESNRARYESEVRQPALRFVADFAPALKRISPHFLAIPSAARGSMFRIHRDVRFSKDKSPYKTSVGLRFFHRSSGDVHAPGYYLHLEPGACFIGMGVWHPDPTNLRAIRDAMVADPRTWKRAKSDPKLNAQLSLGGDRLKRAPKGYDPDHPLIDDLCRTDLVAYQSLTDQEVLAPSFPRRFAQVCAAGKPLMRWLCQTLKLPY